MTLICRECEIRKGDGSSPISESLPNITGYYRTLRHNSPCTSDNSGALSYTAGTKTATDLAIGDTSNKQVGFKFDASNSCSTYQDSAKVRPDSFSTIFIIKAY